MLYLPEQIKWRHLAARVEAKQYWMGSLRIFRPSVNLAGLGSSVKGTTLCDYPNSCVLLFGVTQCNNFLLGSSIFTNKSLLGCLDTTKYKCFDL